MAAERSKRTRLVAAAAIVLGYATIVLARTAYAADEPATAPAPTASLVVSDKAPPGCCCISTNETVNKRGCQYGLSEETCAKATKAVATWSSTWTVGKCPTP
jgi:hypothetical protein